MMSDPYRLPFDPQLSLLEVRSPTNTSLEAYRSILPALTDLQARVYAALATSGAIGLTDEELGVLLPGLGASSVRTRRSELVTAKRVEFTGELRRGASNRRAKVFAVIQ